MEQNLNTNGPDVLLKMSACAPVMAGSRQGAIINLPSMDGNAGSAGRTAYDGSKGAVRTIEYAR